MQRFSTFFNQAQVWIGGYITSWVSEVLTPRYKVVFLTAPNGTLAGIKSHSGA